MHQVYNFEASAWEPLLACFWHNQNELKSAKSILASPLPPQNKKLPIWTWKNVLQTIQASLYNPAPPNSHCPWKQHISKRGFPYTDHPAFLRGRIIFWNSLKAQTNLSFHRSATCVLLKSTSWEPHRNLILTTTIDYYHYWLLIN